MPVGVEPGYTLPVTDDLCWEVEQLVEQQSDNPDEVVHLPTAAVSRHCSKYALNYREQKRAERRDTQVTYMDDARELTRTLRETVDDVIATGKSRTFSTKHGDVKVDLWGDREDLWFVSPANARMDDPYGCLMGPHDDEDLVTDRLRLILLRTARITRRSNQNRMS